MRALYTREVMKLLGVSQPTVSRYVKAGELAAFKFGGKHRYPYQQFVDIGLVDLSDIRELIERNGG